MAKVDFYVLQQTGEAAKLRFACRLAEKAWRLNNTVFIRTADRQHAEQLDELLWTFRDGSFVPHEIFEAGGERTAPVTIGCEVPDPGDADLMINLCEQVPTDLGAWPRVAEVVTADDDCTRLSRQRYADYREQGHSLDTHKL